MALRADNPDVVVAARVTERDPLRLAIGIIAWIDRERSPAAQCIALQQLGGIPCEKMAALVETLEGRS
jgi:hypothetical protein